MSGPEYVEPWYFEVQKAAEAGDPSAVAAKDAADKVNQSNVSVKPQSKSGWFNATTTLSEPNRLDGGRSRRRRSRKSRRTRRR